MWAVPNEGKMWGLGRHPYQQGGGFCNLKNAIQRKRSGQPGAVIERFEGKREDATEETKLGKATHQPH